MYNQPCIIRPTLIDLNPDELYYYSFTNSMNRRDGSCNNIEDPFGSKCGRSIMEDLNLKVFNMIKGINESRTSVIRT